MMTEYIYKSDLEKNVMVRQEEIIRCRDCDGSKRKGLERCPTFEAHGKNPNGFCAWAERDA